MFAHCYMRGYEQVQQNRLLYRFVVNPQEDLLPAMEAGERDPREVAVAALRHVSSVAGLIPTNGSPLTVRLKVFMAHIYAMLLLQQDGGRAGFSPRWEIILRAYVSAFSEVVCDAHNAGNVGAMTDLYEVIDWGCASTVDGENWWTSLCPPLPEEEWARGIVDHAQPLCELLRPEDVAERSATWKARGAAYVRMLFQTDGIDTLMFEFPNLARGYLENPAGSFCFGALSQLLFLASGSGDWSNY